MVSIDTMKDLFRQDVTEGLDEKSTTEIQAIYKKT